MLTQAGFAVALASGHRRHLPLDLPLRALRDLQSGRFTPRGTIQTKWILADPAECYARGLSYDEIQKYSPDGSGLLVAQAIVPDCPAETHVKEADILRAVDDQRVTSLLHFEQLIDGLVGNKIEVRVQRHGKQLQYELQVQDLWTLTPYRLLIYAGCVFQDLRYQTAFDFHVPIAGVLISDTGPFELEEPGEKVICSFDNQPTPNLDAFIEAARRIPGECLFWFFHKCHA